MRSLLLVFVLCVGLHASDLRHRAASKGAIREVIGDFSGFCAGPVRSADDHQDAPWWAGFCFVKQTVDGFQIQVNMKDPVEENYHGRTATSVTFRDDRHATPIIFIRFDDWLAMEIQPSSQDVREEIIRIVARTNGNRDPVVIRKTALVHGEPSHYDNPDIHSLLIDVVGIEWPTE